MKIYTKTGDRGETGLLGGIRVSKDHPCIAVCGDLDETNCVVGVARSLGVTEEIDRTLERIQNDLFDVGSRVATSESADQRRRTFSTEKVSELEAAIDRFETQLVPLSAFILPSGSTAGCYLHLARAVCRRAERSLVSMVSRAKAPGTRPQYDVELAYLNRLSDLLFVLARLQNAADETIEMEWVPST